MIFTDRMKAELDEAAGAEFERLANTHARERWPIDHGSHKLGEKWRLGFVIGAIWARGMFRRDAEKAEQERDEANERAEKHRRAVVDHSTNARCWMQTSEEWQATAEEWEKRARAAEQDKEWWIKRTELFSQMYHGTLLRQKAAEQPRPLTPDAITDEMVERARNAPSFDGRLSPTPRLVREMLTAALTEPPTRPEGAEEIEAVLREEWSFGDEDGGEEAFADLAGRLAQRGFRVVSEDGAR